MGRLSRGWEHDAGDGSMIFLLMERGGLTVCNDTIDYQMFIVGNGDVDERMRLS